MNESDRKFVDGCAIFYRTNKFKLIKEHLVEFNQLAMANSEGSDDMLNRVMTKGTNIYIFRYDNGCLLYLYLFLVFF
jgi:mRNA deadenylase 3'-5' endonuclease subunit Ccr4